MRAVRLILVVLIALALAVLPVSAGLAMPHGTMHETGMNASDDCPCCDKTPDRAAHVCHVKCCGAVAILAAEQSLAAPRAEAASEMPAAVLSPFISRPDPPPPRV
jgi:hypothetical protein